MHFAQSGAAEHWCWVTAHLYEEDISTGVTLLTQDCCEPVLQSRLNSGEFVLAEPLLQSIGAGSLHTCMNSKSPQVHLQ